MTLLYNTSTDTFEPTLACPRCQSDAGLRVYGLMGGPTSHPVIALHSGLVHAEKVVHKDAPHAIEETTGGFCECGWNAFGPRWAECLIPSEPPR